MRRSLLPALALALSLTPAAAQGELRIASYNLLNLFDGYDDPYRSDEGTAPKNRWDVAALQRTIDTLAADVLAVQEVENRGILARLNRGLKKPYPFVELVEGNDLRGIDVGLLSRFPIRRSLSHRHLALDEELAPDRAISRDIVVFELELGPGQRLLVAPVHLKSKRSSRGDPESRKWRQAEALVAVRALEELRGRGFSMPFVILGDFNDTRDSESLAPLFSRWKDAFAGLKDVERWSYDYHGQRSQIDHLLFDGELELVSARVLDDPDGASDHRPLLVVLRTPGELRRARAPRASQQAKPSPRPTKLDLTGKEAVPLEPHLLRELELRARVVSVTPTRRGGHWTIGLGGAGGQRMELFLRGSVRGRFPDPKSWKGKLVEVQGPLSRYRGRYQIELTRVEQLRVK